MNDDDLRARLARLDPQAGAFVTPISDELKERRMTTALEHDAAPPRSRRPRPLVAAAAVVAAVGAVYAVLQDDEPATVRAFVTPAPVTLEVLAGSSSQAALPPICLDAATVLASAQLAFAGTVIANEGSATTLRVTTWFRGGSAPDVVISSKAISEASRAEGARTLDFTAGDSYLIASDGTSVGGPCDASGPDTPELRGLFDRAFG